MQVQPLCENLPGGPKREYPACTETSTLELVLNMLAEASTTELAKAHDAQGLDENKQIAKRGGKVAGYARKALEADTGTPVITSKKRR